MDGVRIMTILTSRVQLPGVIGVEYGSKGCDVYVEWRGGSIQRLAPFSIPSRRLSKEQSHVRLDALQVLQADRLQGIRGLLLY